MKMDQQLDHDKLREHSNKISSEITKVITSHKEPSKEMTAGTMIALGNLLVIVVSTVMPTREEAVEVVTAVIVRAFRAMDKSDEPDTNTKTS